MIDSIQDVLFFKTSSGVYLGCNALFADFVGRPREEIVGHTDFDLFDRAVAQSFRSYDETMLAAQEPRHNEEWITFPTGSPMLVDTLKAPLRNADGQIVGLLGVSRNITERTRIESALRESEANFRAFFETLSDLIVVATREGHIHFANAALKQKLGYSPAELAAMHVLDLHPPEKRQEATEIFGAMLRGERKTCPLPMQAKSGALLPVETRVWLGKWNGSDCIFGLCKDLSAEQEAYQRFERLFRNNPNPMALALLPERRFVDVNDAFLRTLGYARGEVIGSTPTALKLFVNDELHQSVLAGLPADGRFSDIELQVRGKDGAIIDGRFSGEIIESQGLRYVLTVMVDISQYKRITEALDRERERLEGIIHATHVGTWEWNVQTGATEFNSRWAEIIGYSLAELGKTSIETWKRFGHPDDLKTAESLLNQHFRGETDYYECEHRMRHKDGSWVWVLDRGRVVSRSADGLPLRMLGTHQDITSRKRAEFETARLAAIQRELMQLATQCVNVALDRQDAAINQSLAVIGNIICADRSYLFDYDFGAGLMNNTHEWCAEGISPQIQDLKQVPLALFPSWVEAHRRGELIHIPQVSELSQDGPLWQILEPQGIHSLITLPLMSPKGCMGFVGFDAVAHERVWGTEEIYLLRVLAEVFANYKMRRHAELETRRLQEGLEHARDEAQAAAKAKSLFLAHMSHEIRTPLNAILGYAQIMSHSCSDCPVNQRGIETILTSGEHLLNLLNNILFSAKNDNMDIVVEETVFDFHRLLHDTCLLLNGQRSERPILLSAECSPDVPQHLRADSGKIRQILLNLAGNALKFTKQGNIRIAATRVLPADPDTAERPDSLALCVTVSDTGCGIPKTFLPRLFQPFEQAEQTQAGASGVGLGLPISRRLARALGGDIGVSSAVGQGSTFQFTFLAHSVDASPFDEHRELCTLAEGEPRRRVLIVDDDDANRFMLADLLRGAGLESSPAADGQQALALLHAGQVFDVILMDKRMPGLDGTETIRQIRETPDLARVPILLVTASTPPGDASQIAADALADGCVFKPLRRSQLLKAIARVTTIRFTDHGELAKRPAEGYPSDGMPEKRQPLPPHLVERLKQAITMGNMHLVRACIADVRPLDARLAANLLASASAYDYEALRRHFAHEQGERP